jgi:hypothetical protein
MALAQFRDHRSLPCRARSLRYGPGPVRAPTGLFGEPSRRFNHRWAARRMFQDCQGRKRCFATRKCQNPKGRKVRRKNLRCFFRWPGLSLDSDALICWPWILRKYMAGSLSTLLKTCEPLFDTRVYLHRYIVQVFRPGILISQRRHDGNSDP